MRCVGRKVGVWFAGLALVLAVGRAVFAAESAGPPNLIRNPSMELEREGKPVGWKPDTWQGKGNFIYAETGRTGKRSLLIESAEGADVGWQIVVPVEPRATYRLSGWIKTENVVTKGGRGALLNIHNLQPVATQALTGTQDWTRVEVVFEVEDQDTLQMNCLFGGWGLATGRAWFDDLELVQLKAGHWEPKIVIDAAKTGEPISPYIYGQFIEHLGRCIYGGIWAEMLEDRKFFYPVGHKESPWKVLGQPDRVTMDKQQPFVGEHSPRLTAPAGIVHGGLGLVKGKEYVGRIWLRGDQSAGPIQVSLVWADGPDGRQTITITQIGPEYAKQPLRFTAGASTLEGRLEIQATGQQGQVWIGPVSLMPADNIDGMRPDTLAVLKELDAPIYRWPGGNFVSGYDWRKAIGDPDRRPPMKNPAWRGLEHHDFGIDEFMRFCRYLGTEPLVVVNSGLGDVQMAVEELEYANGPADSPMGSLRAKNGHPEPYKVRWWGIGNEMYGNWQLGHMPLEKYIQKHNQFAEAMRKKDPSIKLIAVGNVGPWSEGMMQHCADHMDLVSEHFYCGQVPGLMSHVRQIPNQIRRIVQAHRDYRKRFDSLRGKDIRIAMDEWNYWYGPEVFGEISPRYFLKDALGVAAGLHEYARQSDMVFMANYAQTVNVLGAIKTSKMAAALETTGLVLKLYRRHFGQTPAAVDLKESAPLDAAAAWSEDKKTLTIGIVNPTGQSLEVPLQVAGAELTGSGVRYEIAGADPMLFNDPGQPAKVQIVESAVGGLKDTVRLAPYSVTLLKLQARPKQ
ncbi:MAG TPA: alpha-L-arabinofuranosidase C-terminal domain-containing protein [Thermoguttaceae bacterium]|nr:alpha-L-arabinofuranosidase C-terminal domain-containing protein [Thermoguttaceae bacterium]HPP51992.1 alpha-L-arabinofuranosidase C-terminal domain-containing protein [Thermoguttaceae bacterium]